MIRHTFSRANITSALSHMSTSELHDLLTSLVLDKILYFNGSNWMLRTTSSGGEVTLTVDPQVINDTWTGNNSITTEIDNSFRLLNITIKYDASITNNATVTLDANDGANYDALLRTADNSAGVTSNVFTFGPGWEFEAGDEIVVACNVGVHRAYMRIVYEVL